jgi:putative spermidine/putrescine transport system substrate-binding protein
MSKSKSIRVSRRAVLKGSAAAAGVAATSAIGGFPTLWAQDIKDIELRQVGTAVTFSKIYEKMCEEALGFKFTQTVVDLNTIAQRAVTQPKSADMFEPDLEQFLQIWAVGTMQAVDIKKLEHYDKIIGIYKKDGKIWPDAWFGQGMNPSTVCWTSEREGTDIVEAESTQWMMISPGTFNADTLGARPDLIGRPIESWAELFNPEFRGKTALQSFPGIGAMDVAMALEAAGEITYGDKGNMTVDEINFTMDRLIDLKKQGQFRAFWSTFSESVNLMTSGEVVLQSMWSPAVTAVRARGVECIYLDLKEGYRAWALGAMIPRHVEGKKLGALYDYFNWYHSGPAGAYFAKQGYYFCTPDSVKAHMEPYEWDFWYEGKPATEVITDPFGNDIEQPGTVRDGGAFRRRMGRVAVWNSVMDENALVVKRWNEFLTA